MYYLPRGNFKKDYFEGKKYEEMIKDFLLRRSVSVYTLEEEGFGTDKKHTFDGMFINKNTQIFYYYEVKSRKPVNNKFHIKRYTILNLLEELELNNIGYDKFFYFICNKMHSICGIVSLQNMLPYMNTANALSNFWIDFSFDILTPIFKYNNKFQITETLIK